MEKENRPEKTKSKQIWDRNACLFGASIFLKFIIFDCIWCSYTTFVPFSTIESYATKFIATLLLLSPYILFRRRALQAIILVLLDLLLIANLMYYRTYFTPIPASSYFLAGNLADFTGSVFDSLHLVDILLPLSSLVAIALSLKWGKTQRPKFACLSRPYLLPLLASILLFGITTSFKGGFKQAFNTMKQSPYLCSSGAPIYTVFGCICHDLLSVPSQLTPELRNQIRQWLDERPSCHKLPVTMEKRDNCILILAESLESWVLETKVEGQEITPCLNRLLKDSATLYAPHVLTQVRAGRSIDAQLMINTGLLPLVNGCYSSMYAEHTYPSLPKAMHENKHSHNYLLTIDKLSTWNQGQIARSFGIDTLIAYHDFRLTEAFGTHKRIGDRSFFRQCKEKMEKEEIWKKEENAYLQLVTYSGHAPFKLPNELKELSFSDNIPEKMADYMHTAHYTDSALGEFISYLKSRPDYKNTLVIITGDHEGLVSYRHDLCTSPGGKGIVSDKQFTPFIVLNSPIGLRYTSVMGQIDIYPTLLDLLQLNSYYWSGMGQSILDPQKEPFAVGSQLNIEGTPIHQRTKEHALKGYEISDLIIKLNYFGER